MLAHPTNLPIVIDLPDFSPEAELSPLQDFLWEELDDLVKLGEKFVTRANIF